MDYNLGALKLLCSQLETARGQTSSDSQPVFALGGVLFQRAWIQGILVSVPSSSSEDGNGGRFILDDGTGVIELLLSGEFRNSQWELGMCVMVVGGYFIQTGDLPLIKVHKIVELSAFPDRESMWYLEVMEAFRLFYQTLPE